MSLTEIRKRIDDESKKQVKGILDEAEAEKEKILSGAKDKAKNIAKSSQEETDRLISGLKLEQSASTELSAREIELVAREDAMKHEINRIKADIIKKIRGNNALYKKLFSNAIKSASQIAPIREFSIITNKSDVELIGKTDARIEYQNIDGGLILQSLDKSVRIDATLDSIVDAQEEEIKSMLLSAMFKSIPASSIDAKPQKQKRTAVKSKKRTTKKRK
jgi:vacuolar-type H+-ATPase subunit E/Vma4